LEEEEEEDSLNTLNTLQRTVTMAAIKRSINTDEESLY
jgi:hypothetical protein